MTELTMVDLILTHLIAFLGGIILGMAILLAGWLDDIAGRMRHLAKKLKGGKNDQ